MFFVSLAVAAVFVETQQYYPGNKILCSSSTSKKEKARNRGFFFRIHRVGSPFGGFNPFEKYWSNWIISPSRGENKKDLNHHLAICIGWSYPLTKMPPLGGYGCAIYFPDGFWHCPANLPRKIPRNNTLIFILALRVLSFQPTLPFQTNQIHQ